MPNEKDHYRQLVYELPRVKKFIDRKTREKLNTGIGYLTGLVHFNRYLESEYKMNCNTVIDYLEEKPKEVYDILDGFITYLKKTVKGIKASTIRPYMYSLLAYFPAYDIDIVKAKFKAKVSLPKKQKGKEKPLTAKEIRILVNACTSRRLRPYLLVLASSGVRADSEACNLRNKDVDFSVSPTKIFIRGAKTDEDRYSYISDEASNELKRYIEWKYSEKDRYIKDEETGKYEHIVYKPKYDDNDLVFAVYDKEDTRRRSIYTRLSQEWIKLLETVKLDKKKDSGAVSRGVLTLHSFRRFMYTTVQKQTNTGFAEYILGHTNSPYQTETDEEIARIYKEKCMPYLTFTNYEALEAHGKSLEAKMDEKDLQIQELRRKVDYLMNKALKDAYDKQKRRFAPNAPYGSEAELEDRLQSRNSED